MIDMLEVFLEEIFDFSFIDYPRSDGLFGLLFFLDEDFGSVNFLFFQLTGFNALIDFGFVFLLFFDVFLNVNEGVVSHFFIVLDFGYLFDLNKDWFT
jgi:membrane-associated protease RseP (regulator of RpoE activity)